VPDLAGFRANYGAFGAQPTEHYQSLDIKKALRNWIDSSD
jgi:hypothetical protein